jgi:hypothetical protein
VKAQEEEKKALEEKFEEKMKKEKEVTNIHQRVQ